MDPEFIPIWVGGEVRWWCPVFGCFSDDVSTLDPPATLPRLGKWKAARVRQLSAGVVGDYVIRFDDGSFVARRGRKFYDRRLGRRRGPSPFPAEDRQLCGSAVVPQYLRDRRMYSINSERASTLGQAKRWKSRQAAHKANSKLFGRVVRVSTLGPEADLATGEGVERFS